MFGTRVKRYRVPVKSGSLWMTTSSLPPTSLTMSTEVRKFKNKRIAHSINHNAMSTVFINRFSTHSLMFILFTYLLIPSIHFVSSVHLPVSDNGPSSISSSSLSPSSSAPVFSIHQPTSSNANSANSNELSDAAFQQLLSKHLPHSFVRRSRQLSPPGPESNFQQDNLIEDLEKLIHQLRSDNSRSEKIKNDFAKYNGKAISEEMVPISKLPVALSTDTSSLYQSMPEDSQSKANFAHSQSDKVPPENRNDAKQYISLGSDEQRPFATDKKSSPTLAGHDLHGGDTLYEILASIDSRVQKLQDNMYPYRSLSKFGLHSPSMSPACPNYMSLIKTQFLNIENTIEAKFSNIEHKFSNLEIEEGIWKKAINWKVEEMSSKLAQNENKISFSSEQIMNKLDLIERNFKVVTNDFFAKFMLVNEKLNKIELNLQTKLSDFESKMRKNLDYQQKLTNIFKHDHDSTMHESMYTDGSIKSEVEITTKRTTGMGSTISTRQTPSWDRSSYLAQMNKNFSKELTERQKFTQRLLKLINMKQAKNTAKNTNFNVTFLESLIGVTSNPIEPNTVSNEAARTEYSTSTVPTKENVTFKNERIQFSGDNYHHGGSPLNQTYVVSMNHRNLDSSNTINNSDASFRNLSYIKNGYITKENISLEEYTRCEKLLKPFINNQLNYEDTRLMMSTCRKFLAELMGSNAIFSNLQIRSLNKELNEQNDTDNKDPVDKRDFEEEIVIDQKKAKEMVIEKPIEDTSNQLGHNHKMNVNTKLEELDSKLQFFSTKIIKIVQEMWISSQASESYLKETLGVANKTKNIIKEEFAKLQVTVKPVNQLSNLADEIREPIITRLKEMSSAINNSVEAILNTQAQYITSFRMLRDDDEQMYELLDNCISEVRNKTAVGILQINRKMQEQNSQLNRSLESLLNNLGLIGKRTLEGVKMETIKLADIVKSELYKMGSQHHQHGSNHHQQQQPEPILSSNGRDMDSSQSMPPPVQQCNNDCFITKEEFANICINIDGKLFGDSDRKLGGSQPEQPMLAANMLHQNHQTTVVATGNTNADYFDSNNGTAHIEINNGNGGLNSDDRSRKETKNL